MTQNYAAMIDHTLLKADTTRPQIEKYVKKRRSMYLLLCV